MLVTPGGLFPVRASGFRISLAKGASKSAMLIGSANRACESGIRIG